MYFSTDWSTTFANSSETFYPQRTNKSVLSTVLSHDYLMVQYLKWKEDFHNVFHHCWRLHVPSLHHIWLSGDSAKLLSMQTKPNMYSGSCWCLSPEIKPLVASHQPRAFNKSLHFSLAQCSPVVKSIPQLIPVYFCHFVRFTELVFNKMTDWNLHIVEVKDGTRDRCFFA